jgi:hypothetical protein
MTSQTRAKLWRLAEPSFDTDINYDHITIVAQISLPTRATPSDPKSAAFRNASHGFVRSDESEPPLLQSTLTILI